MENWETDVESRGILLVGTLVLLVGICYNSVHFGNSGHLGPPLSGHYIRLATISDLYILE